MIPLKTGLHLWAGVKATCTTKATPKQSFMLKRFLLKLKMQILKPLPGEVKKNTYIRLDLLAV